MAESSDRQPWWENVPLQAGGDVIIAQIGDNARNVAAGKNITQAVYSTLGPPQPEDKEVIEQKIAQVSQAIDKLQGQIDASTAAMAQFQMKLLQGELTKTGKDEAPSATTITTVGDWLLDQIPALAEVITGLFATPAVGRVVGKAGEIAVKWLKMRFGNRPSQPPAPAQAG